MSLTGDAKHNIFTIATYTHVSLKELHWLS